MKKIEYVYREILFQVIEKKNNKLTQLDLAKTLKISISTVNYSLKPLVKMNAVSINQRNFVVIDPKKILYYWASIRNIEKDIIYQTRVNLPIYQIEKNMPNDIVYGAYSAYKFRFKDAPSDYSEAYIYGSEELKKRFGESKNPPNLLIIQKDGLMDRYGKLTTIAQTFVDLWNIRTWYANEFLKALEAKI